MDINKAKSWYRNAFCKLHFDMHTPDTVTNIAFGFDSEEFAQRLKIASPDAICFFAKSAIGWSHYPTKIGAIHPHLKRDLLREALDACHKHGIKLIAYYCIEVIPAPIVEKHPEYLLRNKDGNPVLEHGERAVACPNSPVQQEHILPQLKEILENYDVDGVFFDGFPALHQICYCEYCRKSFGEEIPSDSNHPAWQRFILWQQKWINDWCTETSRFIHSVQPEALVGINWLSANRYACAPPPEVDYLTADYPVADNCALGTSYQLAGWCWRDIPSDVMNARMLHWWQDWTCRPSAAIKAEFAASIAHSCSLFLGDLLPPETSLPDTDVMELSGDAFRFARERESLVNANPIADVALVNSTQDLHSTSIDDSALYGAYLITIESGHTAHILLDTDLKEHLNKYKTVMLCGIKTLSEDTVSIIKDFVAKGGSLVVCGSFPREADGSSLDDVLGVTYHGDSEQDRGYLRIPDEYASVLWVDWEKARPHVLVHGRYPLVKPKGSKVVSPVYALGSEYQLGTHAPSKASEFSAITANGKVAFCALNLAYDYWKRANSEAKYVLGGLINYVLPNPTVHVKSEFTLQATLAEKENALIVHLLSYYPERRPGMPLVVEKIPLMRNIEVKVRLQKAPAKVWQCPEGRSLQWDFSDGLLHVIIPDMRLHTAIVIE